MLVLLSVKGKRNSLNALIIFHSINAAKILFWCVWAIHKTGTIDLNYLQYVDEHYYVELRHANIAIANLYHLAVIGMRKMGFAASNIKMVNVLVSSFAVVRLYALKDFVRHKRRYVMYIYCFCGVLFLHIVYYSVFALKDAVFFYVAIEFLVQLIQRPVRNRWALIAILSAVLMLIRPPMIVGFFVFLFDRTWTFHRKRVFVLAALATVLIVTCDRFEPRKFHRFVASGLRENMGAEGKSVHPREMVGYAREVVSSRPVVYAKHILTNMRNATMVYAQTDLTNQLILVLEWCTVFYLLIIRKSLRRLMEWWPILCVAVLYFVGGILTAYNIRYQAFPSAFVICLAAFVASSPYPYMCPGYHPE